MDLVMCPNGHPNRPGRSQCVVCRAPLPMPDVPDVESSVAAALPPKPGTPPPAKPPSAATSEAASSKDSADGGCGRWPALLIIALLTVGVVLVSIFWPRLTADDQQTLLVEPTAIQTVAVAVVVTLEPALPATTLPASVTVAVEPTAVSLETAPVAPPEPEPTLAPTEAPPQPTATSPIVDDSQPLDHDNLIVNGDFSEKWVDTWQREVSANNGVQAVEVVTFDDESPTPSGLRITKSGSGTTVVRQTVAVPRRATELRFTGDLRLVGSRAEDGGSEGRVALMLVYLDENGERLGYSVWMDGSQQSSNLWGSSPLPAFGPQLAPRFVAGEGWQSIDIRLQEEFVNRLPLDPGRVKQININLLALASDTCEPTACPVTLEVANLQLLPTAMK